MRSNIENWPMVHKSLGNIACEKHPIYAEDACLGCEFDEAGTVANLKELEKEEVSPTAGKFRKFLFRKSPWITRIAVMSKRRREEFLSLPF